MEKIQATPHEDPRRAISNARSAMQLACPWHYETSRHHHHLHKAVLRAAYAGFAMNPDALMAEWPHEANKDKTRIAYTQSPEKGAKGIYTVTSVGKYLRRHFPTMGDHEIRDYAALYACSGISVSREVRDFIDAAQNGPRSCMQLEDDYIENTLGNLHPYTAYSPELGWGIALRRDELDGSIRGRAIVLHNSDGSPRCYVRSYLQSSDYSPPDDVLQAWLEHNGYEHVGGWPDGAKLLAQPIPHKSGRYIAPYVDGYIQQANLVGSHFVLAKHGDCEMDDAAGYTTYSDPEHTCDDCGGRYRDSDDGNNVGRYDDRWVCQSCCDSNYVYAHGAAGEQYYVVNDEDVVEVNGEYYIKGYLGRYNIVKAEDKNGDDVYLEEDDAVSFEGNWYVADDCIETADEGLVPEDRTWTCEWSQEVYSDLIEPETIQVGLAAPMYLHENNMESFSEALAESIARDIGVVVAGAQVPLFVEEAPQEPQSTHVPWPFPSPAPEAVSA